jgi:WD40 repeat protein/tRNA A-37 threonylcarbamoyl transferase component Bud32
MRTTPDSGEVSRPHDPTQTAPGDGTTQEQVAPRSTLRVAPIIPGYEILGELGRGGMGVVYKARQIKLNRTVALKMILAGEHASNEAGVRFLTEAEAVAKLQHPNIVQIFHVDEHAGHPYFEMEFVGGGSLADGLDGIPRAPRAAAKLVECLARAIGEAHRLGIIHRDLKPANILMTPEGTSKIADFGLVKLLNVESGLTRTDSVLGSPSYMAPEQAEGKTKEIGPAADLYALGAILYELLTGRPPFRGATVLDTLQQVKTAEPVPPSRIVPGVPRDVETIALKCLQKDAGKRYESATALGDDLRRFQAGEPILARPVGFPERAWRWCRRNPVLAAVTGLATAALVAVSVLSITFAVSQLRSKTSLAAANSDLSLEQKHAKAALNSSERLATELALDKGQLLGEQGEANEALLWMARSLKLAPADAVELQSVARSDLGSWRTRINPLRAILRHDAEVWAVAFTGDGKTILTGDSNGTVQLWEAFTCELIGKRIGEPPLRSGAQVFRCAFSPDGKSFLTGGADCTARLWDIATGTVTWKEEELGGRISQAAFSSDGRLLLAIVGPQGVWAELRSVATGHPLCPPLKHEDLILAVAFSPDGKTFVTESGVPDRGPGVARFWDADGKEIRKSLEQPSGALGVAFSPDGKRLLTGHFDGKARLWGLSTDPLLFTELRHDGIVRDVAFSPDGKTLLTGSYDGTARLWDAATGKPLGPPLHHGGNVKSVAFSPDGTTLLTGSEDGNARLWEVAANSSVAADLPRAEPGFPLAFSPDRRTIMTRDAHNSVRLRNAVSGEEVGEPLRHEHPVTAGAFSPNHKTAVTVEAKTITDAWDTTTTRLWDVANGKQIGPILEHRVVRAVACSPDGKTAVTLASDDARLWDAATGKEIRVFTKDYQLFAVAFSPDGKTILTGGWSFIARLWDAAGHERIVEPMRHTNGILAAVFSFDSKTALTGSVDNTARLWELATGKQIGPPLTHRGAVNAVAFSRDGKTVLTGSRDTTARLWDVATGKPLGPPLLHPGPVQHVAFWHDGKTVLTAGEDDIAQFWRLSPPVVGDAEQLELWCQVVTGMELEANGAVRVLESTTWQERRLKLKDSGFRLP